MRWAPVRQEEAHFAERVDDVRNLIIYRTACRRVIAGHLPDRRMRTNRLPEPDGTDPEYLLGSRSHWGDLLPVARELVERSGPGRLTAPEFSAIWPAPRPLWIF